MTKRQKESALEQRVKPWITQQPDGTWSVLVEFSLDQIAVKELAEKMADSVMVWLTKLGPPKRHVKQWVSQQADGTWSVLVQFNMDQFLEEKLAEKIADRVAVLLGKWPPPRGPDLLEIKTQH